MLCPGNQQKELHQARATYKFHQAVARGILLASWKGVPFGTPLVPIAKNTLAEKPKVLRVFRSSSKINVYTQILCNSIELMEQWLKQREIEGIKTGKLSDRMSGSSS
jgi:hypothetical protein